MRKNRISFRALSLLVTLTVLLSSLSLSAFAEYSIYKPDGITFKDNAYIRGNDTAVIYIPGYRCSNLEMNVDLNNDGESKKIVCFAVGSEIFEVSENNSFVENLIYGIGNLLISGIMLLTNSFRNDEVNVSEDGGFGISDIYVRFFNSCVEKFGESTDVIIYDLDWRQELSITVNELYQIIKDQGYKKVILVTQSMGGLIASGAAKLLRDDLNDDSTENDVELYTVNVGAAFLGSFDFFYNKTEFEGIDKLSPDYFTYKSKVDYPSHAQLGVPAEYGSLYGNEYAVAAVSKADGTVVYEQIDAEKAFEEMKVLCEDLELMEDYYDNYIFIDHDNNPDTPEKHIMETLGTNAFYISGTSCATSAKMQINYVEDENGNKTAISCNPVVDESATSGDGVLTTECSTLNFCSPETTFYVPYDHKSVLFHSDAEHLVFDILAHIIGNPQADFDYTATEYEYVDIYSQPVSEPVVNSDNTLYPQVVRYVLSLLGIDIPFETSLKFCNILFSVFGI